MNFSRYTNINKSILANNYRLVLRLSSSTPDSSAVNGELQVSYSLFTKTLKNFILEIDGNQFKNSVKGVLLFKLFTVDLSAQPSNRVIQDVELDQIKDEDSMPVELEGPNVEFDFDYDEFHGDKDLKATVDSIDKIMGNPVTQTAIFLVSLNPLMFSFSANILNRFVYFRGLEAEAPANLTAMFAICGSGWGLKTGKTKYDQSRKEEEELSTLDKMLNIRGADQDPPLKFKVMKFTDIYIKSALPIILINFSLYLVVLLIILLNKSLGESEIERLKKIALDTKEQKGKKKNQI